jgi:hypothetical protein
MAMTKIRVTKPIPESATNAGVKVGQHGWLTAYTREQTDLREKGGKLTNVRFPAKPLGYEGSEPVFMWIPNDSFEVFK